MISEGSHTDPTVERAGHERQKNSTCYSDTPRHERAALEPVIEAVIVKGSERSKEAAQRTPSHRFLGIGLIAGAVLSAVALWAIDFTRWHIPICSFHRITGYLCPTCGGLRAMHALLHGRLAEAWSHNGLVVLLTPWAGYGLLLVTLTMLFGDRAWPGRWLYHPAIFVLIATAAIVFGIVRNLS